MKVTLSLRELARVVPLASKVASGSRSQSFGMLYVSVTDGGGFVMGGNGTVWTKKMFSDSYMNTDVSFLIAPADIAPVLGAGGESAEFDIDIKKGHAVISWNDGKGKMKCSILDAEDYQLPTKSEKPTEAIIPMMTAMTAVKSVFIAAEKGTKLSLTYGMHFKSEGGKLSFAATNSHRIHVLEVDYTGPEFEHTLSPDMVNAIGSLSGDAVVFSWDDSRSIISAAADGDTVSAGMLSGKYPNWKRVIPVDYTDTATIDAKQFAATLKRALDCAPVSDRANITVEDGVMMVDGRNDSREFSDSMPCECSTSFKFAASAKYLIDAVRATGSDTVKVHKSSRNSLTVTAGDGVTATVMGMVL